MSILKLLTQHYRLKAAKKAMLLLRKVIRKLLSFLLVIRLKKHLRKAIQKAKRLLCLPSLKKPSTVMNLVKR